MTESIQQHLDRLRSQWRQAEPAGRESIAAEAAAITTFADVFPDLEVIGGAPK